MKTSRLMLAILLFAGVTACDSTAKIEPTATQPEHAAKKAAPFDVAPKPVGGFAAIQQQLTYPEEAKKSAESGRVILTVKVAADGSLKEVRVLKSSGSEALDNAAIKATKAVQWTPAIKDGKTVKAEIGVPVLFELS